MTRSGSSWAISAATRRAASPLEPPSPTAHTIVAAGGSAGTRASSAQAPTTSAQRSGRARRNAIPATFSHERRSVGPDGEAHAAAAAGVDVVAAARDEDLPAEGAAPALAALVGDPGAAHGDGEAQAVAVVAGAVHARVEERVGGGFVVRSYEGRLLVRAAEAAAGAPAHLHRAEETVGADHDRCGTALRRLSAEHLGLGGGRRGHEHRHRERGQGDEPEHGGLITASHRRQTAPPPWP